MTSTSIADSSIPTLDERDIIQRATPGGPIAVQETYKRQFKAALDIYLRNCSPEHLAHVLTAFRMVLLSQGHDPEKDLLVGAMRQAINEASH